MRPTATARLRLLGFGKSFGTKVTEHQHLARAVVLHDPWYKSIELFKRQFHESLPKNKKPAERFARQRADQCLTSDKR